MSKMKHYTTEEKVLQILIDKNNGENTNIVTLSRDDLSALELLENETTRSSCLLETSGMLKIKQKSIHNDLSMPWRIELFSSGVHYFENKKKRSKTEKREWIKTYVPIAISLISLVKSFWTEIISALQWIMQLLK